MFQYAFARAYAERYGHKLQTDPWIGELIFQLYDDRIDQNFEPRNGNSLIGEGDVEIVGYNQDQRCMIYSEEQARGWFKLRPEVAQKLSSLAPENLSHRRVGDYRGNCYPLISEQSYRDAWQQYGYEPMLFVTEENPMLITGLPKFLPDFYRLMTAPVMFRANSTFSWWAGVLNPGKIYSPESCGLTYGIEHDHVPFIEGNYARICDLDVCTCVCLPK